MAMQSGFFMSVGGDRKYNASFFADYFASFVGNGIFPNPSTNFQVLQNEGMTVSVSAGKGWINGYYAIDKANTTLNIDVADGVLNRIDLVVLRWNLSDRQITLSVKKGTFASSPQASQLQRDADAYELCLAEIYVAAGATQITQSNITDTRLDAAKCGIVHGVVDQVDTTEIFNQYQAYLNEKISSNEFANWLNDLKNKLDPTSDVAVQLQLQIDALQNGMTAGSIVIADTGNNFTSTNVEGALSELFTSASNGKEVIKNAITGADGSVPIPTDPTFNDLATAIEKISKTKVINGKWEIPDYVQGTWGPVLNPAINYGKTIYFDQFKSVEMLFFKSDKLISNIGYVDGYVGVYIRNKNGSNYKILLRDNTNSGNISYEFNSSFSVSNNALSLNAPGYLVNYTVVGY